MLIPEPKRLDREECRLNLLHHIEELQELVEGRLQAVEDRLEEVEAPTGPPAPGPGLGRLAQDLRAAKRLNAALPDRA
jgi:hypothetical protein